ncbi:MAG: Hpt domain-containing protein, partial [Cyanobacteria bacterium J06636_16]
MTTDQTIRAQGYQYFQQEAPELLQVLEQGLLTLQEDSSINKVNTLMRATHTIKGAAASLELETIAKVAHSLEDIFRALCRPDVLIDAEADALLFEGFECLRSAVGAELTEAIVNEDEILNRTATIFARLQDHLGDCFDQDTPLPTSAELGFDVTQSIFEVGVMQRLEQLAAVLETEQPEAIANALRTQAEVFLGLGESLNLPGFGAIAQVVVVALDQHPEQAIAIGQLALQDFRAGQAAVLAGDRTTGGRPSETLQALAQTAASDSVAVDIILNPVTMEEAILPALDNDLVNPDLLIDIAAPVEAITYPEDNQAEVDFIESTTADELDVANILGSSEANVFEADTGVMTSQAEVEEVEAEKAETETENGTGVEPATKTETDSAIEIDPATEIKTSVEAVTEAEAGDSKAAREELSVPSIQKLFQWVRKSVQLSTGQTGSTQTMMEADLAAGVTDSGQEAEQGESDQRSADNITHSQDVTLDTLFESEADLAPADTLAVTSVAGTADAMLEGEAMDAEEPASDELTSNEIEETGALVPPSSYDVDADALLENIWGGITASQGADDDAQSTATPHLPLSVSASAVTPEFSPQPTTDPEVLKLKDVPNPTQSRASVQQPTPMPQKGVMPAAPTVRIQIEHLDQLNYAVGELLTNHNQQSLQAEQIQASMRRLYVRLRQHQNLLSQLQDWLDDSPMPLGQAQNGNGTPHNRSNGAGSSPIEPPFRATSLQSDPLPDADSLPIGFDTLELDQYSEPQLVIQSLLDDTVQLTEAVDAVELYTRQSRQTQEKQGRLLLKTRDALIEGRMFPLGQLFDRFPRVLQQLETLHHKPIELTLQGTDVLVDKAIGERLYDPLLHLVRNAFDHGIEPVKIRQALAKPEAGQLAIAA